MSYLYDKQGEGDADLRALEERLAAARYSPQGGRRSGRSVLLWAVAASLLAATPAALYWLRRAPPGPSWAVTTASGGRSELRVGSWWESSEASTVVVADIGHVALQPKSKLRVVETSARQHRLELLSGSLHAKVNAPPRLFVVDTPAAQAVDLGCEYDLAVGPDGATVLTVATGEVSLEGAGVSSRVSAGATARTRKGQAPSLPHAVDASAQFVAALAAYEGGGALEALLASAQAGDAVSLWNLLARVEGAHRVQVLDRLNALLGRSTEKNEPLLRLESEALEELWQAFP